MKTTIRQLREERGESQRQLAHVLGATPRDIQDLEAGSLQVLSDPTAAADRALRRAGRGD